MTRLLPRAPKTAGAMRTALSGTQMGTEPPLALGAETVRGVLASRSHRRNASARRQQHRRPAGEEPTSRVEFLALRRARTRPLETGPWRLRARLSSLYAGIFLSPCCLLTMDLCRSDLPWLQSLNGVLWISGQRRAALMMMLMAAHSEAAVWGKEGPGSPVGGVSSL